MPLSESAPLTLDPRTLQLGGPQGRVDVTDPECILLRALALSPRCRLDTPQLLAQVGKQDTPLGKRALEVQLVRLRKKLEQAGALPPTIKAIRGIGYLLCVPIRLADPPNYRVSDHYARFFLYCSSVQSFEKPS
jgi:DNA-binding response OmpR family regulator